MWFLGIDMWMARILQSGKRDQTKVGQETHDVMRAFSLHMTGSGPSVPPVSLYFDHLTEADRDSRQNRQINTNSSGRISNRNIQDDAQLSEYDQDVTVPLETAPGSPRRKRLMAPTLDL